jgi:flagellar protein FliO/FliZ
MKMLGKGLLATTASVVWYGLAAVAAYAEGDEGLPDIQSGGPGSIYWMMFKVVAFLVVIIGIFLLIMKVISQKNKIFQSGRSMKSIGGLGLGQNKSVQVIQIGNSLYVLGVGNDVKLVAKIDDPDEIQYITDNFHVSPTGNFKSFPTIGEWIKGLGGRKGRSEELEVTSSFQAVFQEKMQRMANRQQKVEEMISQDHETHNERLNDKS